MFLASRTIAMTPEETRTHDRFLRLYSANEPALRGFVRSLLPTREDAREVMQELALVLWRKFSECTDDEGFRPWSFAAARYAVLAWRRDRARDRHVFGEEALAALAGDAERMAPRLDAQREALEECLEKLPADQRDLVATAYAPGRRLEALAAELGRSAMALYKTLHRIRLALIDCTRRVLAREGLS